MKSNEQPLAGSRKRPRRLRRALRGRAVTTTIDCLDFRQRRSALVFHGLSRVRHPQTSPAESVPPQLAMQKPMKLQRQPAGDAALQALQSASVAQVSAQVLVLVPHNIGERQSLSAPQVWQRGNSEPVLELDVITLAFDDDAFSECAARSLPTASVSL